MVDGRTLENARESLIICNQRAKYPVTFDAGVLSDRLQNVPLGTVAVYTTLGNFAREAFLAADQPVTLGERVAEASESGFSALARLLSFSPAAYAQFCRTEQRQAGTPELGQALKQSQATPVRFMDLPRDTNNAVEEACALRDPNGLVSPYFRFEATHGEPSFVVDDDYFAEHTQSRPQDLAKGVPEHWQRCAAMRLVKERIWPGLVDVAVATPEVFEHDLAMFASLGTI